MNRSTSSLRHERYLGATGQDVAIIEFLVDDVDAKYRKLAEVIKNALVEERTIMP